MKVLPRILTLLLLASVLTVWTQPALAAQLANVSGKADTSEKRDDAQFKLSEHSQVTVEYKITKVGDPCNVKVRVHRKQADGNWLVVNTVHRTTSSSTGSRTLTLPAGDYKIEVIAKQASYDVSVDK